MLNPQSKLLQIEYEKISPENEENPNFKSEEVSIPKNDAEISVVPCKTKKKKSKEKNMEKESKTKLDDNLKLVAPKRKISVKELKNLEKKIDEKSLLDLKQKANYVSELKEYANAKIVCLKKEIGDEFENVVKYVDETADALTDICLEQNNQKMAIKDIKKSMDGAGFKTDNICQQIEDNFHSCELFKNQVIVKEIQYREELFSVLSDLKKTKKENDCLFWDVERNKSDFIKMNEDISALKEQNAYMLEEYRKDKILFTKETNEMRSNIVELENDKTSLNKEVYILKNKLNDMQKQIDIEIEYKSTNMEERMNDLEKEIYALKEENEQLKKERNDIAENLTYLQMETTYNSEILEKKKDEKTFTCDDCGKVFKDYIHYNNHVLSHKDDKHKSKSKNTFETNTKDRKYTTRSTEKNIS